MPTLYSGSKPADFKEYREKVSASLRRPEYGKAFSLTTRQTDHAPTTPRPRPGCSRSAPPLWS